MASDNPGWADRPGTRRLIRRILYVACGLLVVTDFFVHRHIVNDIERVPAFYALYGFVALVAVVMAAKGLRRLVKRDEDYYDR
jgi:hypothetical protein